MRQVSNDHPRLYLGDCWETLSGWLWSTPKAQRAIWYAYPLGRQVILCVSKRANSAPEWICHNFFSKLLRQHPRFPWTGKKKTTITWTTLSPMQITECGSQRSRFNSRSCSYTFWWTEQVEYTTLLTKGNDRAWFNTDNWNLASDSSLFCKQNEK